jgi:pseudouridine kinase
MHLSFSRKPLVLVIGSAHMDVLGDFAVTEKRRVDKEGEVYCSIGGSAFNIAVDVANEGGVEAALFTHVRRRSPVTDIIFARLREEGVSTRYVVRDANIQKDSGFIAQRAGGELVSAVSSMPVEDAIFDESVLASVIHRASIVVAECNLSGSQLALIARLCEASGKVLIVGGVSESKCQRIRLLEGGSSVTYFSLNAREAKALLGKPPDPESSKDAVALCQLANAEQVIVTEGSEGWAVFSSDGTIRKFAAPKAVEVRSSSGAGDALIAGLAHYLATHDQHQIDWTALRNHIHRIVADVLRKRVASGADLTSLEILGSAYMQRILANLSHRGVRFGAIVAATVAGLGLLAALIQAEVSLETSTKLGPSLLRIYCSVAPHASACIQGPKKKSGK